MLDSHQPRVDDELGHGKRLVRSPMNGLFPTRGPRHTTAISGGLTPFKLATAMLIGVVVLACGVGCGAKSAGDERAASASATDTGERVPENGTAKTRRALALSTEFLPYQKFDGAIAGQLVREIGRQAILIAAREELGVATRDQTLGELDTMSTSAEVVRLLPQIRSHWSAPTQLSLLPVDAQGKVAGDTVWQTTIPPGNLSIPNLYPTLAKVWEEASRKELVAGLRRAGLHRSTPPSKRANKPSDKAQKLLGEMNFISQYHAVRLAHQALIAGGASAEWLEVLARGYAHLCSLTAHHWTSGQEAFAARALLYTERCGALGGQERRTNWLRAYVLAIIGAHGAALSQVESLGEPSDDDPHWSLVIEPFCRFEREKLGAVGEEHQDLEQLTNWLAVCLGYFYDTAPSFHDVAQKCLQDSPDAYGVYRLLVMLNPSLSDQRFGAFAGPPALAQFAPAKLLKIDDLPDSLQRQLPRDIEQLRELWRGLPDPLPEILESEIIATQQELTQKLPDPLPGDPFTPLPRFIIEKLREAKQSDGERLEPSWAMLADLVEEEQFVMAASYCHAIRNAVESSHKEAVDGLLPLIEGHPYRAFIATYALSREESRDGSIKLLADLEIPEPRHNMGHMLRRAAIVPTNTNQTLGYIASWEALNTYDYRLPSMHEEITEGAETWWEHLSTRHKTDYITFYRTVSPHCPHWLRVTFYHTPRPTLEQLEEWAPHAKKDSFSCRSMGGFFMNLGMNDKAIEWHETAYKMEPDYTSTVELAELYRSTGHADKWLPTLERFLNEEEERGLDHSNVHRYIATTYMEKDFDFERAKPHAVRAAQSYSAGGLASAVEACEGLAEWEEADRWAREVSRNYPSYSGQRWYFFRRRTGRGEPGEARPYMTQYLAVQRAEDVADDTAAYQLLEGDKKKALELFQQLGAEKNEVYWYLLAALIADDLKEHETRNRALTAARNISTNYVAQSDPNFNAVIQRFCDLAATESISNQQRQAMETDMAKLIPAARRDYECFFGRLLELRGDVANADRLLVSCVSTPPFENLSATIAGHFLVQRRGVSRDAAIEPPDEDAAQ